MNQAILRAALRKVRRIILTVPPRHGKSETVDRWGTSWYLGTNPRDRVILASYEAGFASEWGRKSRDVMNEFGQEFFNCRVREDVAARHAWEIEKAYPNAEGTGYEWRNTGGGMVTAGVGGSLTGRGGNLVIIDDPIKNAQEAFSPIQRENVWEWFNSTLMTRLEPDGVAIIIMTRWHEDDLAGRLISQMENGGEHWEIINYPAIAEENDPLGREVGEALWPERYPIEVLEAVRRDRGEYWFSAMYQQRPIPVGKALFAKQFTRRYTIEQGMYALHQPDGNKVMVHPNQLRRFTTVDLATSTKQTADFTVFATWGLVPQTTDVLLLDVLRERFEGPDHIPMMRGVWMTQKPYAFYVEANGFQLSTVQTARRAGLPIFPLNADTDKVARALTAAARHKGGSYYFPVAAPWLSDVEKELYSFPAGEHDDFVDTMSYSALVAVGGEYVGNLA